MARDAFLRCGLALQLLAAFAVMGCGRADTDGLSNVGAAGNIGEEPGGAAGSSAGISGSAGTTAGVSGTGGTGAASGTSGAGGSGGSGGTAATGGLGGTGGTSTGSCAEGTAPVSVCDGSTCDRAIFTPISFGAPLTIEGDNVGLVPASLPTGGGPDVWLQCASDAAGAARVFAIRPTESGFLSAHLVRASFDVSTGMQTGNTTFDSMLYAMPDCSMDESSQMIACADNDVSVDGVGHLGGGEMLSFQVQANTSYFLYVDGYQVDSAGPFKLELALAHGTCDDPATVQVDAFVLGDNVRPSYGQITGSTAGQSDHGQPACAPEGTPDVVYYVTQIPSPSDGPFLGYLYPDAITDAGPWLSFTHTPICDDLTVVHGSTHGCGPGGIAPGPHEDPFYIWVDGYDADLPPGFTGKPTQGHYGIRVSN